MEDDGPAVFDHACRLGFEGIVSKRLDAPYRSGPSRTWLNRRTRSAFDLIQLQDDDLRDEPLVKRKQRLAKMLGSGGGGIAYNEHLEGDGPAGFHHVCRM